MKVLGVDPAWAKPLAYALVSTGSCPKKPVLLFAEKGGLLDLNACIEEWKPDRIYVEDQFMKQNYDTAKKLSWSAGMIMGLAIMQGIEHRTANVASWKAEFLEKRMRSPEEVCKEIWNVELDDDRACAALIAYYGLLHI